MNPPNELQTNWLKPFNEPRSNPDRTPVEFSPFAWPTRKPHSPWPPAGGPSPWPPKPGEGGSVSEWTRRFLRIQPDPVQTQLLDLPAHRLLLNCTRQWGKTTICAAKALHFALNSPKSCTLVAAPTARQSTLFLNKIRDYLRLLAIPLAPVPNLDRSILLPNQAQIISLPGRADNVRGFTAHLLIFDEAARIPNSLFEALNPTLATTNGPLWLLSTPNGLDNIFYDLWHAHGDCPECPPPENLRSYPSADVDIRGLSPSNGALFSTSGLESECGADLQVCRVGNPADMSSVAHPYTRITVTAAQCPRLTPEFLATQRLMLGDTLFRQEYQCEFLAGPHALLSLEVIQNAIDPSILPLFDRPLWN